MSSDEQAAAYCREAELTLTAARAIHRSAEETGTDLWAQVVKNGYDAIEQAVSAEIAARNERIPRRHPAKINAFIELADPPDDLEALLLRWLGRRSNSQYVDIRGDRLNVPHEQFDRDDAQQILEDADRVLEYVERADSATDG